MTPDQKKTSRAKRTAAQDKRHLKKRQQEAFGELFSTYKAKPVGKKNPGEKRKLTRSMQRTSS
jgi:hypothetical protein